LLSGCLVSVLYVVILFSISLMIAGFGLSRANDMFALVKEPAETTLTVEENQDIKELAESLKEAKIIRYPNLFRFYMHLTEKDQDLVPGTYTLSASMDYRALAKEMGTKVTVRESIDIVIPEGYTQDEIFNLLEEKGVCTKAELLEAARNYEFNYTWLSDLEHTEKRLEGYLFPDTYTFYIGDSATRVLGKFLANFNKKYDVDFKSRVNELETDLQDILIIASMIEKEAKTDEDRPFISSVIYNRMASDSFPYLQIDATVLYAIGEHKDTLTDADLAFESPYNTYVSQGLPIGPICNPGLESMAAALYPEETEYYYYVAKPDGTHIFTTNLNDHNKAVEEAKRLWEEAETAIETEDE